MFVLFIPTRGILSSSLTQFLSLFKTIQLPSLLCPWWWLNAGQQQPWTVPVAPSPGVGGERAPSLVTVVWLLPFLPMPFPSSLTRHRVLTAPSKGSILVPPHEEMASDGCVRCPMTLVPNCSPSSPRWVPVLKAASSQTVGRPIPWSRLQGWAVPTPLSVRNGICDVMIGEKSAMGAETERWIREKPRSSVGAMRIDQWKSRGSRNDEEDKKAETMSKKKIQAGTAKQISKWGVHLQLLENGRDTQGRAEPCWWQSPPTRTTISCCWGPQERGVWTGLAFVMPDSVWGKTDAFSWVP